MKLYMYPLSHNLISFHYCIVY